MNAYSGNERRRRRIDREHFMMFHFLHFAECRAWTADEMIARLKCEGLLAQSTYRHDPGAVIRFWHLLQEVKL